ncbi:MAG: bifunctional diaminohydroxyphosphoribosylaminopyrimidine deaminase/5-amino-6-(5-phosphoribosylamino)uracil reductase RibD [Chryseotalea sp.]
MHNHEIFMQRAIQLAENGRGWVSPNPMVGCVIVHNEIIIGEGWHKKYGDKHAEVNAIEAVENQSLLQEATVYVSLEPCSHFGKTPPCADLLIGKKVKRVVVGAGDPNPLVNGKGIKKLRDAGIEVIENILADVCAEQNKRFFLHHQKERPYIILKWAQTADSFIAQENYESKWISGTLSRQLVHKWRTEEDAILVGRQTALHDNPQLTARDWPGKQPQRVVIDRFLKLPESLHLFDRSQPTLVYNVIKHEEHTNLILSRIDEEGFLWHLTKDLHKRKIQSVIIEGGATTLQHFIDQGLWDEARIFTSSTIFGKGIRAPHFHGILVSSETLETDIIQIYRNPNQVYSWQKN